MNTRHDRNQPDIRLKRREIEQHLSPLILRHGQKNVMMWISVCMGLMIVELYYTTCISYGIEIIIIIHIHFSKLFKYIFICMYYLHLFTF